MPDEFENEATQTADFYEVGVLKYREGLVRQYHKGALSLLERMEKDGPTSTEKLVMEMIKEVVCETDHLLGNELVATQNGNIRDASIISGKRAEVLNVAIKAVQAKQSLEQASGLGVDVDSPLMGVVFKFFLEKLRKVFLIMGFDTELSDTFFRMYKDEMKDWRKELKAEMKEKEVHGGDD